MKSHKYHMVLKSKHREINTGSLASFLGLIINLGTEHMEKNVNEHNEAANLEKLLNFLGV